MNSVRTFIRPALLASILLGGLPIATAQEPTDQQARPADNTKVNERDRNKNEPTADQQKENRSDRDITQQIRKSIIDDKSLSTYAHNVKIITQNGMLKGPVRSAEEKTAIEAKAGEVVGRDKVTNELDVKQLSARRVLLSASYSPWSSACQFLLSEGAQR